VPKIISLNEILVDFKKSFPNKELISGWLNSEKEEQKIIAILIEAALAMEREGNEAALKDRKSTRLNSSH
jgi:hypothetical protein